MCVFGMFGPRTWHFSVENDDQPGQREQLMKAEWGWAAHKANPTHPRSPTQNQINKFEILQQTKMLGTSKKKHFLEFNQNNLIR